MIGVLSGCSFPSEQEYEENVSLKIVKSGVKIEEVRFDEDLGIDGKQIYKFTIPIEITGTFQHDCTIPVYYYFDMEKKMYQNLIKRHLPGQRKDSLKRCLREN